MLWSVLETVCDSYSKSCTPVIVLSNKYQKLGRSPRLCLNANMTYSKRRRQLISIPENVIICSKHHRVGPGQMRRLIALREMDTVTPRDLVCYVQSERWTH